MNRLPEQLVAWHNRHPLALRITVNDVHTVGVVALPFMRSGSMAAAAVPLPARMIEPVLHDPAVAEPAEAGDPVWGGESVLTPEAEARPTPAPPRWKFWLRSGRDKSAAQHRTWPVFSERFIDGLSVPRISAFAQARGFATRPGQAAWPTREVSIDDDLIAPSHASQGAWPLELYLISAAIDASEQRRIRVLIGQGTSDNTLAVLGRRCLSPLRVGGLGLALLLLIGGASAALWWPHGEAVHDTAAAVVAAAVVEPAASAASAAAEPASEPMAESASAPEAASSPASAPLAASEAEAEAASEPTRDIRPRLVERVYPPRTKEPTRSMLAPAEPASAAASKPLEKAAVTKADKADKAPIKPMPSKADGDKPVVALVGPPSANKADAEALLERLRTAVEGAQGKSNTALQATVFQTPEGWRAAVWPFASREEAQIINATLVARGMRTRAVDF